MNTEFIAKNYEIGLLATVLLYVIFPTYAVLFLICTVVAMGRGHLYKERLEEFLKTLSFEDNTPVEVDMAPMVRTRINRKRRGSLG
jgi:hypothetical protein